jgi:hypothetical protein
MQRAAVAITSSAWANGSAYSGLANVEGPAKKEVGYLSAMLADGTTAVRSVLSGEEREQLEALIRKGKSAAQRLLKARILLKADVSEAGEGFGLNPE